MKPDKKISIVYTVKICCWIFSKTIQLSIVVYVFHPIFVKMPTGWQQAIFKIPFNTLQIKRF